MCREALDGVEFRLELLFTQDGMDVAVAGLAEEGDAGAALLFGVVAREAGFVVAGLREQMVAREWGVKTSTNGAGL